MKSILLELHRSTPLVVPASTHARCGTSSGATVPKLALIGFAQCQSTNHE